MALRIGVQSFASLREAMGGGLATLELPEGACVADAWNELARRHGGLAALANSTRIARNGRLAAPGEALCDGDELALLPPVGGG